MARAPAVHRGAVKQQHRRSRREAAGAAAALTAEELSARRATRRGCSPRRWDCRGVRAQACRRHRLCFGRSARSDVQAPSHGLATRRDTPATLRSRLERCGVRLERMRRKEKARQENARRSGSGHSSSPQREALRRRVRRLRLHLRGDRNISAGLAGRGARGAAVIEVFLLLRRRRHLRSRARVAGVRVGRGSSTLGAGTWFFEALGSLPIPASWARATEAVRPRATAAAAAMTDVFIFVDSLVCFSPAGQREAGDAVPRRAGTLNLRRALSASASPDVHPTGHHARRRRDGR